MSLRRVTCNERLPRIGHFQMLLKNIWHVVSDVLAHQMTCNHNESDYGFLAIDTSMLRASKHHFDTAPESRTVWSMSIKNTKQAVPSAVIAKC